MFEVRLAPMCGVTDHIFRSICYEMGCDLAYTEMISAMGYLCAPKQKATRELMIRGKDEPKLVLQLFGKDPDIVAEAAKRISESGIYDGIDLNMGCPARKIAPSGEGSGLMRTPVTAYEMMRKTVASSVVPVTAKMRLGYDKDHINIIEFAKMAQDAGLSSITVHGRTREQQYGGEADWEMIANVKQTVSIPVFGNGDIFSADQAIAFQKKSRTDGIMIGRGAMGNPWIFRDIKARLNGRIPEPVNKDERYRIIIRHYQTMLQCKPQRIAVNEMRKHIGWYIKGLKGAAAFRTSINCTNEPDEVFRLIRSFFENSESI